MTYKIAWYYIPLLFIIFLIIIIYVMYLKLKSIVYINATDLCLINIIPPIKAFSKITDYDHNNSKALCLLSLSTTKWTVCGKSFEKIPEIDNFELVAAIKVYDTYTDSWIKNSIVYYSKDLNMLIISFSGTKSVEDWIVNLDYETAPASFYNNSKVKIKKSYLKMYESMRNNILRAITETINDDTLVVCTGHSMGGCFSAICYYDIIVNNLAKKRVLYSYGSPRVGNNEFAKILTDQLTTYRVTNTEDIVTAVPFSVMGDNIYCHYGQMIPFSINLESVIKNHVEAYFEFTQRANVIT